MSQGRFIALLDIERGDRVETTLKFMKELKGCEEAYFCLGEHDILAEVSFDANKSRDSIIEAFIESLDTYNLTQNLNHIHYLMLDTKESFVKPKEGRRIVYSFITTKYGLTPKAVENIKEIAKVNEAQKSEKVSLVAYPCFGLCDVVVRIEGETMDHIEKLLVEDIIAKNYVRNSSSALVFKECKDE